jgi:hypothetical protein
VGAFVGAGVEGSGRGRRRNDRRWGGFNGRVIRAHHGGLRRDLKGGGNGQGVKEEGRGWRQVEGRQWWWRRGGARPGQRRRFSWRRKKAGVATWAKQANRPVGWLGQKGWVGPAERLRPSGEGEASRLAGLKAEWAGKGSWAKSEK